MADNCIECDVAIVGSGFAGSLIAKELSRQRIRVVILEAGPGVQPNINGYMRSFYKASIKVPESPYPPALSANAPSAVAAGRPRFCPRANWKDPEKAYLDQEESTLPFKSTYERLAGGTSHWMGLTPRLVPNDFRMKQVRSFVPGLANRLRHIDAEWYEKAEAELGVSGDVADHSFAGVTFSPGYAYPMPRIPPSLFDRYVNEKLAHLTDDDTKSLEFLGTASARDRAHGAEPAGSAKFPALSESPRLRRQYQLHSDLPDPGQIRCDHHLERRDQQRRAADRPCRRQRDPGREWSASVGSSLSRTRTRRRRERAASRPPFTSSPRMRIETPRLLLMSTKSGQPESGVANSSGLVGCNLMDHPQFLTWGLLPVPVFPYRGPLVTSAIGDLCDGPFRAQRAAFRISLGNEAWSATVGGTRW